MVNITDIRIRLADKPGNLKGTASITVDSSLAIHDIKILEGPKGLFIGMPSRKDNGTGEFRDIVHPIESQTRQQISEEILQKYTEISVSISTDHDDTSD